MSSFFLGPVLAQGDPDAGGFDFGLPGGGEALVRPVPDEEEVPDWIRPKFATAQPDSFDYLKEEIKRLTGVTEERDLAQRIERAAFLYFERTGRWPGANEMLEDPTLIRYVNSYLMGDFLAPPMFEWKGQVYDNSSFNGWQKAGRLPNPNLNPNIFAEMDEFEARFLTRQPGNRAPALPTLTDDDIARIRLQAPAFRGSGGGRGGGVSRQPRPFDKREIRENVRRYLERTLREPAADAQINQLVTEYITEAQAFWMGNGGSVDISAFLQERVRGLDRYRLLYDQKPAHMSEGEYMSQFDNTAAAFGLRADQSNRQVVKAASAGVAPQGFRERLSKSLPVRRQGQGRFSQQLAETVGQLGALGRS